MEASIDVISHKEVVGVLSAADRCKKTNENFSHYWRFSADFKKFNEIVELAVEVTADGDRSPDSRDV